MQLFKALILSQLLGSAAVTHNRNKPHMFTTGELECVEL